MANAKLVDYYSILNLPHRADLAGIENAYARLSDEFAMRVEVDETSAAALRRINEAYGVLSRPELRREYDRAFFGDEFAADERKVVSHARRRDFARRVLIVALAVVVLAQTATLGYLGREYIADFAGTVFAPILPGDAS